MKYFLGFLASIGLIILAFVLVLHGVGSGSKDKPKPTPLVDYANTSRTVELTVQGPVTADENHKAVRITVGQNSKQIEILQGYDETVATTQSYPNTESAYAEFLRALDLNGFTRGTTTTANKDDRGYCSSGYRYAVAMYDGADQKQRFWASSCGRGSFAGNITVMRTLFQKQIPDYNKVAGNLSL